MQVHAVQHQMYFDLGYTSIILIVDKSISWGEQEISLFVRIYTVIDLLFGHEGDCKHKYPYIVIVNVASEKNILIVFDIYM